MKIKNSIIEKINTPKARTRLAYDLKCGEATLSVHIRKNKANGRLTKMDALSSISKEVGFPINELLEESNEGQAGTNIQPEFDNVNSEPINQ